MTILKEMMALSIGVIRNVTMPMPRIGFAVIGPALLLSLSACVHPLLDAAGRGDTKSVLAMVDQGTNVNLKDPNMQGATALHWAARAGQVETARALLDRGADVNAKDVSGDTPLSWAIFGNGGVEIARLLLDRGADPNAKTESGEPPPHPCGLQRKPGSDQALAGPGCRRERQG